VNVTFITPAAGLGGAERCLLDMIRATRRADPQFSASAILLDTGPLLDELNRLDVPTEVAQLPRSLSAAGDSGARSSAELVALAAKLIGGAAGLVDVLARIRRIIDRNRPVIVHSNGFKTHLLTRLIVPRGSAAVCHMHDFVGSRTIVSSLLSEGVSPEAYFIANSRAVADDVRRVVANPSRVSVVYNAIDVDAFIPANIDAGWLDRAAGIHPPPAHAVRVGLVATYALWKGQDVFIRAVSRLPARVREAARFYIVGGPIYQTAGSQWSVGALRNMARQCGVERDIGFVPFQSDAVSVMQSLDVVVHASTQPEPFGRTIVEAMACGKAVIVAQAGGAAELFTTGLHALGIKPGDVEALALAMTSLIDHPKLRHALGAAARPHAVTEYGLPRLGEQIYSIYSTLAAAKRG